MYPRPSCRGAAAQYQNLLVVESVPVGRSQDSPPRMGGLDCAATVGCGFFQERSLKLTKICPPRAKYPVDSALSFAEESFIYRTHFPILR